MFWGLKIAQICFQKKNKNPPDAKNNWMKTWGHHQNYTLSTFGFSPNNAYEYCSKSVVIEHL